MTIATIEADTIDTDAIVSRITSRSQDAVIDVIETGRDLLRIKPTMRGQFSRWIDETLPFDHRTGQRYMSVAHRLGDHVDVLKLLTLASVYALAGAKTPGGAVEEVLDILRDGQRLTDDEVLTIIKRHTASSGEAASPEGVPRPIVSGQPPGAELLQDLANVLIDGLSDAHLQAAYELLERLDRVRPRRTLDDLRLRIGCTRPLGMDLAALQKLERDRVAAAELLAKLKGGGQEMRHA